MDGYKILYYCTVLLISMLVSVNANKYLFPLNCVSI